MKMSKAKPVYFSNATRITTTAIVFAMFILILILNGCANEGGEETAIDCSGVSLSFTDEVFPVIQSSCVKSGCHGAGSNNGPGELLTFSQISKAKSSIRSSVSSGEMPRDGRLSANEKNTILCWVENGASNN